MNRVLPDNILRHMSAADRKPLGKAGQTMAELEAKATATAEKELTRDIRDYLGHRGVTPLIPKFGKATGILPGWPDVTFAYRGIPVLWELKIGKNKLQQVQEALIPLLVANGWHHAVIRSIQEAKAFLDRLDEEAKP